MTHDYENHLILYQLHLMDFDEGADLVNIVDGLENFVGVTEINADGRDNNGGDDHSEYFFTGSSNAIVKLCW